MESSEKSQPLLLLLLFSKIVLCLEAIISSFHTGFYPTTCQKALDPLLSPLCQLSPNSPVRRRLKCRFLGGLSWAGEGPCAPLPSRHVSWIYDHLLVLYKLYAVQELVCVFTAIPTPCLARNRCSINTDWMRLNEGDWRTKDFLLGFWV